MDDVKGKMKGFMKNLTTSSSKFKGEGRVLGSSSSSSSSSAPATNVANSRLLSPAPNPKPKPKPNPIPNPKPSNEFSPFDPLITTSNNNRSAAGSPDPVFNCPICSHPFPSESAVSDHVDVCLAPTNPCSDADTKSSSIVAESISLYMSNQPPRESVEVVLRLLGNVVREPGNDKFRRIRMGNPKIKEAVGDVRGGVELLESVGFRMSVEEGGEIWGMMEAPTEDGVRVIKDAVLLMERWNEGGKNGEEGLASGAEENKVVERKKIDRRVK